MGKSHSVWQKMVSIAKELSQLLIVAIYISGVDSLLSHVCIERSCPTVESHCRFPSL